MDSKGSYNPSCPFIFGHFYAIYRGKLPHVTPFSSWEVKGPRVFVVASHLRLLCTTVFSLTSAVLDLDTKQQAKQLQVVGS